MKKKESYFFFFLVALNAIPIFETKFFLTHDGPAHLYNSVLIRELIGGHDISIHQLFQLNPVFVPNLTSHLLLALFSYIFPVWIAEKIVLLIYFFGLPYAFRFLLRKSAQPNLFFTSLILPFTFSYFLYLGFYNFLLALVPFFIFLGWWTNENKKINFSFALKIFACLCLIYFSHIYVFVLAILIAGLHTLLNYFLNFNREMRKIFLKEFIFLFAISLPIIFVMLLFISRIPFQILPIQPSFRELTRALLDLSSLNRPGNFVHVVTSKISLTIFLLTTTGIIYRFIRYRKKEAPLFVSGDTWLLAALILLCLYFTIPDYIGGGMNCLRIQQLLFICVIVWVAQQIFPKCIQVTGISLVILLQAILVFHYSVEKNYGDEINEWVAAGEKIEKGTLTLPIIFTNDDNWIHSSGYMGATSSLALYANYEAGLQWFPVIWNNNFMIRMKGLKERNPLTDDRNPAIVWMKKPILYPDNIIIWDKPQNKSDSISFCVIDSLLQANFKLSYQSQHLKLYKQNK